MRLLDRYLLRELLVPLAYCLCGFLLLWISADLFGSLRDFQEKRMHGLDIIEYYLVETPEFLITVLPIALLLALLYTLTNHARHHEITAIRAAGIGLWRLSLPYLGVGLAGSLLLLALNELWVPESSERAERIHNRRVGGPAEASARGKKPSFGFVNERDGRQWVMGEYIARTGEMINPRVEWTQRDGSVRKLDAQRAKRIKDVWTFFDVTEFRYKLSAQTNELPVPLLRTNVLAMPQFTETPEQIRSEIKISNLMTLPGRGAKKADLAISEILNYLSFHPQLSDTDAHWLYTKLQGRLSTPWTCLVVVVIALPFGAASGRRNVFVGVASSVVICFGFFVLREVGLALGVTGEVAPWLAAWLPNLVFASVGLWLTSRVR